MKVLEVPEKKLIIIELEEDLLDCFINDRVNEQVKQKLASGYSDFIIDFTNVRYVKSTGIGVLIRAYTSINNSNGRMALTCINDKIAGLLELTNLHQVFDIYESVDEVKFG